MRFLWRVLRFLFFYMKELTVANIRIARDVLSPELSIKPEIVEMPIEVHGEFQIFFLSNFITMSPGTLTVDVSVDQKSLFIHFMHVEDAEGSQKKFNETYYSIFRED